MVYCLRTGNMSYWTILSISSMNAHSVYAKSSSIPSSGHPRSARNCVSCWTLVTVRADYLDGTHSLSSPSHISLLFSKTFNISIPLQHIPTDTLEFEHTAPEDDADLDSEDELDLNDTGVDEVGRWKRKSDGKLLGEGGKGVKFTVIG
jgi:hypothetical protein